MEYKFWGWQNADVRPVTDAYKGIDSPIDLYNALTNIWCVETCAPRLRASWSKDNMTLGQCSITAFLVQDIFGGDVYGILRPGDGEKAGRDSCGTGDYERLVGCWEQ